MPCRSLLRAIIGLRYLTAIRITNIMHILDTVNCLPLRIIVKLNSHVALQETIIICKFYIRLNLQV